MAITIEVSRSSKLASNKRARIEISEILLRSDILCGKI